MPQHAPNMHQLENISGKISVSILRGFPWNFKALITNPAFLHEFRVIRLKDVWQD